MKTIKCPKCKSNQITIFKKCFATLSAMIDYENNKLEYFGENNHEEGQGLHAECCDCEHIWKLRKYNDFDDIEKEILS